MNRDAAKPEMKSTQSEEKSPAAGKNQRAEENMQGQRPRARKTRKTTTLAGRKGGQEAKSMSTEKTTQAATT